MDVKHCRGGCGTIAPGLMGREKKSIMAWIDELFSGNRSRNCTENGTPKEKNMNPRWKTIPSIATVYIVAAVLLIAIPGLDFYIRSPLLTILATGAAVLAGIFLSRKAVRFFERETAFQSLEPLAGDGKSLGKSRLVLLAAFSLPRLLLLLILPHEMESDFLFYINSATEYAQGSFPNTPFLVGMAPNCILFIWMLGSFFKFFGCSYYAAFAFDFIFGAGSVLLLEHIAGKFLNRKMSFVVALIYALLPSHVLFAMLPSTEKVTVFALLLGEALVLWALECKRTIPALLAALAAGAVLAVSASIRPIAPLLLAGLLVALLVREKKASPVWKQLLVLGMALVVFFGSAALLDGFTTSLVGGTKADSSLGWALFEGLDVESGGTWLEKNSRIADEVLANYPTNELNAVFLQKTWERVSTYSLGTWVKLFMYKNMNLWLENSYSLFALYFLMDQGWLEMVLFLFVAAVLIVGHLLWMVTFAFLLLRWAKSRKGSFYAVTVHLIPILCLMAWHSLGTSIPRYHYVVIPYLLLLTFVVLKDIARPDG